MSRLHGLLLLSLVTLVVALVPVEWWLRGAFKERHVRAWSHADRELAHDAPPTRRKRDGGRALRLIELIRIAPWRDLVYELRPGVEGRFSMVPYTASSHGMRGPETSLEKPEGVMRIALLGDSVTFGWGVLAEERFGEVLEVLLDEALPEVRVEVLNFGVPGYNTALEAACLERKVLDFEPDLVLVQYLHNDRNLPNFLLKEPRQPAVHVWAWLVDQLGIASDDVVDEPVLMSAFEGGGDAELVPPELAYMVGMDGVERALNRIAELTREAGIPVALMVQGASGLPGSDPKAPRPRFPDEQQVLEIAEDLGFATIDTHEPTLRWMRANGKGLPDLVLSETDWHPNATWHALLARILAEHILAQQLLAG